MSTLPPELMEIVPRETYVPSWRSVVADLEKVLSEPVLADPVQQEFAAFWKSRHEQIRTLMDRADALGRQIREASLPLVLCHADLHSRNVLLEGNDELWIIDWDETVLAPKERDLMFFVGGIANLIEPHQTRFFLKGYGDAAIDPHALAYYRYARAVEDMGANAERILFTSDLTEESRRDALAGLMSLFEPGNIVELAFASDPNEPN
jgi:spectinomycin phosphotransferase